MRLYPPQKFPVSSSSGDSRGQKMLPFRAHISQTLSSALVNKRQAKTFPAMRLIGNYLEGLFMKLLV